MEKTSELKKILMGNVVANKDNVLVTTPKDSIIKFNGIFDGWLSVLILGVRMESRDITLSLRKRDAEKLIDDFLSKQGRRLYMEDNPQAKAVFASYIVSKPTIIAVEDIIEVEKKTRFTMTVCTGKNILAGFRSKRTFRKFGKTAEGLIEEEARHEKKTSHDGDSEQNS